LSHDQFISHLLFTRQFTYCSCSHHSYTAHFLYRHNQAHLTIHKSTHVCMIDVHRLSFDLYSSLNCTQENVYNFFFKFI